MTNLSDLFPAGAGKQVSFVASGTLSNGQAVGLKTDGTVEAITGATEGAGTPVVFEAASSSQVSSTFDSANNKIIIAYTDEGNSDYGTAIVGTVSGTSISFGTAVVFESAGTIFTSCTFDSASNKVVIAYQDQGNTNQGTAIVGTVSATAISFGTAVVFAVQAQNTSCSFDSASNKVVISYTDANNLDYGTGVVGTVSGTAISFGTPVVFEFGSVLYVSATFDSDSNKVVIAYRDGGNSDYGTAVVGTVSGTAISFGTAVVYETANSSWNSATFDSNSNKVVIGYRDGGNSDYGTVIVGTVSGTSISFGTAVVFEAAISRYISATFDSNSNKVVIGYRDGGNSNYGTAIVGTVSGTSISFGAPVVFETAETSYISATFDSNLNKAVIAYQDNGNSSYGTAAVFTVGSTNNTSFIGITDAAISSAASGNVTIKGGIAVNGLSSLTPGSDYYVQADGTISTVSTGSAVKIGRAMSATSINLEYQS